ncbi:MAG: hypothetical protein Q3X39_04315, partial [Gemmiger sp.]|nr:hypothetical protein [Gemmiger sp.]
MLYSAPWGLTWCSGTPAASQNAFSAPIWYITSASASAGEIAILRRPKPCKSGSPGCAPTCTPYFLH